MKSIFRIGTRASPLALAQAGQLARCLARAHGWPESAITISKITTSGDRFAKDRLRDLGGKGLFVKEIDQELTAGNIDCAIHSAKDLPTKLPKGLMIAAILRRETPCEAFVSKNYSSFAQLPPKAIMGTASLRRQAIICHRRPDVMIKLLRGNVGTRLKMIAAGRYDGTILALAGLKRLGLDKFAREVFTPEQFIPAPAQGALAVEARLTDAKTIDLLAPLNDHNSAQAVSAERAFLARLEGSCRTPIAAYGVVVQGRLNLLGAIAYLDGSQVFKVRASTLLDPDPGDAALELGIETAQKLIDQVGKEVIDRIKSYEC